MPFTARYVFSYEDYGTLVKAINSRSRLGWLARLVASAIFLVWLFQNTGNIAGLIETQRWMRLGRDLLAVLTPLVFFIAAIEVLSRTLLRRQAFKQCPITGVELTFYLDAEGVSWTRAGMRGQLDWAVFRTAIVKPAAVALLIGKCDGIVLPVRAFASRQEFEAAVAFIRAKVQAEKAAA